ncbi:T9SS type B sorting domain-containing protein [Rasiella sp. SM2506]|uniref:T9SS type B sorting domain-containing protein n=1 Tax=Rasiella sp. SM2506 TaxID=3423914 RepID=UPI003D7AC748
MKKLLLLSLLLLTSNLMLSQQVDLFQQFNGRYDFTGLGNTLNPSANPCQLLDSSSADLILLPTQSLVSAHLYWSAPGPGDFNVRLNNIAVTASRTFSLISGVGTEYFGGYADVTNVVSLTGSGQYTFSDMQIDLAASNACNNGTDFGGWAMYVIYEDPSLLLNQISLFDGLEFVSGTNPLLEITLSNIDASSDELAKIGFLAWEGDLPNPINESLRINGVLISNALNPVDNAFNGTNSYTGSIQLYNMDLDVYDLEGIVMPGDTSINIALTSSQDFVMVNNLITSVNSEIPDATIVIDNLGVLCQNRDINVNYTVYNVNSTALLPANTPIAFYVNNALVGQSLTVGDIPIDGSESGVITLNLPVATPPVFDLKAVVDDVGNGTGIVAETNEDNNEFILPVDLNETIQFLGDDIDSCIGLTVTLDTGVVDPAFSFEWYFNGVLIVGENDPTLDVTVNGTYRAVVTQGLCTAIDSVDVFFNVQPVIENPAIDLFQCNANGDTGFFDLTQNDPIVLGGQDPADFNVTYHLNQDDANTGANRIITAPAYQITTLPLQPIFVRVEELSGTCSATDEFFIQFDMVTAGPMTNITDLCDPNSDGSVVVDLRALKNAEALNGQSIFDFSVSYHPTQLDATNGTNALLNPYNVTTSPETIFVRVANNDSPPGSCGATSSFQIEFFAAPVLTQPTVLEVCDEAPNDGFAAFDLTTKDDEITGSNPEAVVSYYIDPNDAQNGVNRIRNPTMFVNTNIFIQTIYARADNINSIDCFNVIELDLQVNESPTITNRITDYVLCDNDQDGVEEFDLTSKEDEIANTLVNLTFSYHNNRADAIAGTPFIANPTMYNSGGETIWVRVENVADCFTVGMFDLVVDTVPEFVEVPQFEQCDDNGDGVEDFDLNTQNAAIVNRNRDLSVTYHPTEQDAMDATAFLSIPYTSSGEVIWVRVESNTRGCYGVFDMELIIVERPEIFQPDPLVFCDDDNDGFGEFILTDADDQVVNGNPAGNLEVSYHELLVDAQNNVNPLTSPYENIRNPQILYVRLTNIATGCYSTTTLELIVEETPQISNPDPLEECDDDGDGEVIFNLTDAVPQILSGLTGGPYDITYFVDAALTNAITNPTAYSNIRNPQTIYITVRDSDETCEAQTELLLIVNLPPTLNEPLPYTKCDVNNPGDQTEEFDLTTRIGEITGGDPTISVSFYLNVLDAQAGTNAITNPTTFSNTENPQDIYIRGESASNCEEVGAPNGLVLELRVESIPNVVDPTPLEVCDVDNDGVADFNLITKDAEIANGGAGITVTYYETRLDAENGTFALVSPYRNITLDRQTVYARATFSMAPNDNLCFKVVELDLIVLPTPQLPLTIEPIIACEEGGTTLFDLTEREEVILNGLDPLIFTVSYHVLETEALNGTNAISMPTEYRNIDNPQTIYVRVAGNTNDNLCASIGEFEIIVREPPVAILPVPFTKCDDLGELNDGMTVFDLTEKNEEITGPSTPGVNVNYYVSEQDAEDGINPIDPATAYTNTSNPQIIFVRVDNVGTDCSAFTRMELRVIPNPVPGVPDALIVCDQDENPMDGLSIFNLTDSAAQIQNGASWLLEYYETYADAVLQENMILNTTDYPNTTNPQIIYVRVTNDTSVDMCFEIVELELIVNPAPDASAEVTPLVECQYPNTGRAEFNLTSKKEEILGTQNPELFEVTYYETFVAAQDRLPIPNPERYMNLPNMNPQTIFVGIENKETMCYITMQSFLIRVDDGAIANTPVEPYTICDNTDPNDGIADFTLEDADPTSQAQLLRNEILAGNDPGGEFILTYHETLANAEAGIDPLGSVYTNLVNPQIIYARVENSAIDNECFATAEVILKVEQLPVLTLEEEYRLCVDADGFPIEAEFGGPSPPVLDTGLSPDKYIFVWELNGTVLIGEVGPSILAVQAGVYTITVTERTSGCMQTYTTTVIQSSPPTSVDANIVNGAFAGEHIIEVATTGDGEYVFQLDDGPFQTENVFRNVPPGGHTITVQDSNGCGSAVVEIGIVDYPRFMTPNQDGWNDTWNIIGIADADPAAKIYIFDRHGKLLKQISPLGEGWDGTYNGNPLPSSDYWFRVDYTEDETQKEFRGHFTLKR